ncbi:YCII-related protein [Penicillium paradoxum]|uniref:YCII-related protein n=1 Tax=Penicillium paradoxum TaxID=176176 RepID=UPI002548A621|nr:YCII-related protein [Penicillium paradoxum]KAJ5773212.1 YCII-related protein [Penicillium paradoxum]
MNGGAIFKQHLEDGKDALFKGGMVVPMGDSTEEVRAIREQLVNPNSAIWDST